MLGPCVSCVPRHSYVFGLLMGVIVDACTGVDTFFLSVRSPEPKVIEMEDNEDWLTSTVVQLDKCKFSSM